MRLGDQLLACSGFAQQQDRRPQRADLLDEVEDPPHLRALGNHRMEAVVLAQLGPQLLELVDQPPSLQDPFDEEAEMIRIIGFGQKIVRAGFHGAQSIGGVAVGGEHDDSHRDSLRAGWKEGRVRSGRACAGR